MQSVKAARRPMTLARLCAAFGAIVLLAACGAPSQNSGTHKPAYFIDPSLKTQAITEAKAKNARGERVWCVPFARTASGVDLRGNAGTWWNAAKGAYERGDAPHPGSVMAFSSTRKMPMGHVAVVSEVVSSRKILIDHANWNRNQISLKMPVIDVSPNNDWSQVRVAGDNKTFGSIYPVNGFIYPDQAMADIAPAFDQRAAQSASGLDAAILEALATPMDSQSLMTEEARLVAAQAM